MNTLTRSLTLLLIAAPLALTGCASTSASPTTHDGAATHDAESSGTESSGTAVTLTGGWAKAADAGGMTGLFGTLHNSGTDDLTIERVDSEAAGTVELHEVTSAGVMQQITDAVTIPGGGHTELAPGANHIMLMDLRAGLLPGDDVTVTVTFTDGSRVELTVPVKDYSAANEEYTESSDHHDAHHAEH